MRYNGIVKKIHSINVFDAEIDLGFKVRVNVTLRLLNISSLKQKNDKTNEAIKYLQDKLLNQKVEIDIKLAKEHSLAIVYLNGKNINEDLLQKGLAKKFEIKARDNG